MRKSRVKKATNKKLHDALKHAEIVLKKSLSKSKLIRARFYLHDSIKIRRELIVRKYCLIKYLK